MNPRRHEQRLFARNLLVCLFLLTCASSIAAQSPTWIRKGPIPTNAVRGGSENGRSLYVCRSSYMGGVHPGKIVGDKCNIGYGGREIILDSFEILVGSGRWRRVRGFNGAFAAGSENGKPLYLCRGSYGGGVHPGKVIGDKCNIGYGGAEKMLDNFEVFFADESRFPGNDSGSRGRFPLDAVEGGDEKGQTLYVCRASYMGGMHPGKVVADKCNIGYAGKEVMLDRYEVLTGNGRWGSQRINFMGAFAAGSENGRTLYLCRGNFAGGVHPGKVVEGKCNIGYAGEEKILTQFEVFYDLGVNWVRR